MSPSLPHHHHHVGGTKKKKKQEGIGLGLNLSVSHLCLDHGVSSEEYKLPLLSMESLGYLVLTPNTASAPTVGQYTET